MAEHTAGQQPRDAGRPSQDVPHQGDVPAKGVPGELHQDRYLGQRDLTHWKTQAGRALSHQTQRAGRRLGARSALLLILAIGAAIAATMTWLAGETYEAVTEVDGVALWDQPVLDTMVGHRSSWLDTAVTAFTHLGGPIGMPLLAFTITALLALRRRSWTPVILIVAATAGSLLMTLVGKDLVGRIRPPLTSAVPPFEHSASFPSGHSLNALVVAGVVAYLLILRQRTHSARAMTIALATLFAVAMGLSRVYLGHHWLTDVLVAWALGLAWLTVVITAHRLYLSTQEDEHPPTAARTNPS